MGRMGKMGRFCYSVWMFSWSIRSVLASSVYEAKDFFCETSVFRLISALFMAAYSAVSSSWNVACAISSGANPVERLYHAGTFSWNSSAR